MGDFGYNGDLSGPVVQPKAWTSPYALADRVYHLKPTSDCNDDFVGIGGPTERLGLQTLLFEELRLIAA